MLDRPLRAPTRVALVAGLALIVGAVTLWAIDDDVFSAFQTGDTMQLPSDHLALELLARAEGDFSAMRELATESGVPHLCGASGVGDYEFCLVYSDDVLAVVPFDNGPDTSATITSPGFEGGVEVHLDARRSVGIRSTGGMTQVIVRRNGEFLGGARGME